MTENYIVVRTSPERPFQIDLAVESPFWMIVACILANRTRGASALFVLAVLRNRWPDRLSLASAHHEELRDVLRPLGFDFRRATTLRALAAQWLMSPPETRAEIEAMPGCGKYAADSWSIFVEGDLGVRPTDHVLKRYLEERGRPCIPS